MKKGTICRKYTDNEKSFIKDNYRILPTKEICAILGRTKNSVTVMANKMGLGVSVIDLKSGDKFNRLTVVCKTEKRTKCRSCIYKCRCECGNFTEVPRNALVSGHTRSCGCYQRERVREAISLPPGKATSNQLFYNCRSNAQKRNLEFCLTMERHENIVLQDCDYCGEKPRKINYLVRKDGSLKKTDHSSSTANVENSWTIANTVDRTDSEKGYTLENCVPSCWPCNQMKMEDSPEDFISHAYKIVAFQESKKQK